MCTACEWAPHFSALTANRRTVLRAATIVAATAAVGTLAACAPDSTPAPTTGADPSPGPGDSATTVFRNGRVYTVAGPAPWAQAVAVTGNTISYVGDDAGAMALAGPDTRVIDLGGKLLMPGFVEGHTHPFLGAFLTSGVNLQVPTLTEALDAIAAYAKANPTGPVRGFGWRVDMFGPQGPTRADLDRVLPDRPGFFFAIDGHSLWANSKALELAGVSRDTPDPIPGFSYYARDENGEPTGYVLEVNAVLGLVDAVLARDGKLVASRLVEELGESANVATLDGDMVVYVDQVASERQMRMFTEVGRRVAHFFKAMEARLAGALARAQKAGRLADGVLEPASRELLATLPEITASQTPTTTHHAV